MRCPCYVRVTGVNSRLVLAGNAGIVSGRRFGNSARHALRRQRPQVRILSGAPAPEHAFVRVKVELPPFVLAPFRPLTLSAVTTQTEVEMV
jgi:hypothetical protein